MTPAMMSSRRAHVDLDDVADARVEHLHRDPLPALQHRGMHLAERGGGDGRALDRLEAVLRALAEAGQERALHVAEGLRGHLVLQALELLGERAREEPPEDAQHLPELDEDAAEPQHPPEQAPRVLLVDALAAGLDPPRHGAAFGPQDADERELQHVAREDDREDVTARARGGEPRRQHSASSGRFRACRRRGCRSSRTPRSGRGATGASGPAPRP